MSNQLVRFITTLALLLVGAWVILTLVEKFFPGAANTAGQGAGSAAWSGIKTAASAVGGVYHGIDSGVADSLGIPGVTGSTIDNVFVGMNPLLYPFYWLSTFIREARAAAIVRDQTSGGDAAGFPADTPGGTTLPEYDNSGAPDEHVQSLLDYLNSGGSQ